MKYIYKVALVFAVMFALGISGCKKYLDENNPAGRTAETYYNTASGFEDLVKSNYTNLRPIMNWPTLYNLGTDVYSTLYTTDTNGENLYNSNLNSANGDVSGFFTQLYSAINVANTTLYWSTQVTGGNAANIAIRVGEAKMLRAYYYYLLVETFGDVPLVLTNTTTVTLTYARTPEQTVYTQIVQDLNDAIAALPATTTDAGRVTKGAAQHLLAKVYLTRAYKTYGGGAADFTLAATTAEAVINSGTYALQAKYSNLFDPTVANFQANSEVIFAVQFSTNTLTNGTGSTLYQYFLWDVQNTALLGRSLFYGRTNGALAPDPYYFSLYDKTRDSRYLASYSDIISTQVAGSFGGTAYAVGDTLIYYPAVAFTTAQKATKKYIVVNPTEYRTSPFVAGGRSYPMLKKFHDPGVTSFADGGGTRNVYLFRLGETHLIAAEAYLQLSNLPKALTYFNAIRARAAKTGVNPATNVAYSTEMQVSTLTLSDILDERARELTGEEFRWFELKRTGTLVSRTLAHNDEAQAANTLKATHNLRPIPQSVIDLNRGTFPQNPGY